MRDEVRIRRVGFRDGTDDELAALHAVESEVDAERRPHRAPQPLESYVAFARSLPTMFDDHTWLAEDHDGTPVATGACWSNTAGDPTVMECDVVVRRTHRRSGIGTRLFETILATAVEEGTRALTWQTFDAVPAGAPFSERHGGTVARVNRTSELRLDDVDWEQVRAWASRPDDGYSLERIDGPHPPDRRADGAAFHHIMQTQPHDDLAGGDVHIGEDDVAELDRALVESGRERWTLLVRAPDGTCVGGTELHLEPWQPDTAHQQNTGIDPAHRGRGLAKWVKAAMLEQVRAGRPEVVRVCTGNAFSNAAMLAINDALGFRVISVRTEWQRRL